MSFSNTFRITRFALIVLLASGLLVRFAVHAPTGAAAGRVVSGVDLVGQVRGLVGEVARNAQELAALDNKASSEEIARRRNALEAAGPAFERVRSQIGDAQSSWVSLGRVEILLKDAEAVAADTLRLTPSQPVSPKEATRTGATEADPNKTGFTEETRGIIDSRVAALLTDSDDLRKHVGQVAVEASEAKAALFGFRVPDLLTALLVISTVVALVNLYQAEVRLRAPPDKTLKIQLQLRAKSDVRAAIQRCYELSTELLELADRLLRQTREAEETSP